MASRRLSLSSPQACHRAAQALLVLVGLWSLFATPYSKVEESFQLQATHDLYYHGLLPAFRAFWLPRAPSLTSLLLSRSSSGDESDELSSSEPNVEQVYDHLQFPGVVPRSFAGPLVLSLQCRLVQFILRRTSWLLTGRASTYSSSSELSPAAVEYLARFFLLLWNWSGWFRLGRALNRRFSTSSPFYPSAGTYLLLVTASQFHVVYYASRMLPNVFALVLTLHAFSSWIELDEEKQNRDDLFQRCTRASAVMLVAAATIFRCDLVILVFTVGLSWLLCGQLTVGMALVIGVVTVSVCLLFTVPLDSMLWQKWTWPEGVVLYYNTVLNKSSDWGTSPWYWYWTSALPRALLFGFPLFPMSLLRVPESMVCLWEWWRRSKTTKNPAGKSLSSQRPGWQRIQFVADSTWIPYLLPALGYVALYSFLGHKEVRFLFPVLPLFNVGVAVALSRIHAMLVYPGKDKPVSGVAQLIYAGGIGALVLSLAASLAFVEVSRRNYPGGLALDALTHHVQKEQQGRIAEIRVHVDVASAMTGVSKFAEREAQTRTPHVAWTFSKAGYEEQHLIRSDGNMSGFTHLLSEIPSVRGFHMLKAIPGNPRLDLKRLRVTTSDAIYVLENDEFR